MKEKLATDPHPVLPPTYDVVPLTFVSPTPAGTDQPITPST